MLRECWLGIEWVILMNDEMMHQTCSQCCPAQEVLRDWRVLQAHGRVLLGGAASVTVTITVVHVMLL